MIACMIRFFCLTTSQFETIENVIKLRSSIEASLLLLFQTILTNKYEMAEHNLQGNHHNHPPTPLYNIFTDGSCLDDTW